jgi:glycosyltransferase involved in cell wall biosynthesis
MPEVSVLMAVCNGARFLREAIESVLYQTLTDFEFLIVDDGSTDNTRQIIQSYEDPRVRLVVNGKNLGLARSLNLGLSLARADLVARMDADDISEPQRLSRQVAFMQANPETGLGGSWYREIDEAGRIVSRCKLPCEHVAILWSLLFYCPIVHSAAIMRKSALERVGVYDETLTYSMDYELWSRISNCMAVANLDEYLVRWRRHDCSMTSTYGKRSGEGQRMRVARLREWLGWTGDGTTADERRSRILCSLAIWPQNPLAPADIEWGVSEVFRLHTAFCERFRLPAPVCATHRTRLMRRIGWHIVAAAYKYPQQTSNGFARHPGGTSRFDWPALSRFEKISLRLMLATASPVGKGLRFLRSLRC